MPQLHVRIDGMSCQHCVRAVFTALAAVEGIERSDVGIGTATIEHDGRATLDAVRDAVAVAGYAVTAGEEQRRRLTVL